LFREATYWFVECLKILMERKFVDGWTFLLKSIKRQESIPEEAKRLGQQKAVARLILFLLSQQWKEQEGKMETKHLFQNIASISLSFLGHLDPIVRHVSVDLHKFGVESGIKKFEQLSNVILTPGTPSIPDESVGVLATPYKIDEEKSDVLRSDLKVYLTTVNSHYGDVLTKISEIVKQNNSSPQIHAFLGVDAMLD